MEWTLSAHGGWASSDQQLSVRDGGIVTSADVGEGSAWLLGLEARFHRRFGIAVDVARSSVDFDVAIDIPTLQVLRAGDSATWMAIELSTPISLVRRHGLDLFVAPVVAQARFDDIRLSFAGLSGETVIFELDDEAGLGARLGLRTPIGGSRWSFAAHVQYLDLAVSGVDRDNPADRLDLNLDPWRAAVGLGWSF